MSDVQRQPLKDANKPVSRLPMPGSKIARPTSKLPMPSSVKRPRSPNEEPAQKRPKVEPATKRAKVEPAKPATRTAKAPARPTTTRAAVPARTTASSRTATVTRTTRVAPTATTKPGMKRHTSSSSSIGSRTTTKPAAAASKPAAAAASKRPGWDLKGRLQDLEEILSRSTQDNASLKSQMTDNVERIMSLESNNTQLKNTVVEKEQITHQVSRGIEELERKLRAKQEELDASTKSLRRDIEELEFSKSSLNRQKETLEGELSASRQEVGGLKGTVAQLTSAQAGISAELTATKLNLEQQIHAGKLDHEEIARLKALVAQHEATIEEANTKLREEEGIRRKLHNTIQELKGNIRVFCRVRPLLGEETLGNDGAIEHINFPEEKTIILEKPEKAALDESTMSRKGSNNNDKNHDFNFDRVFSPESTQEQVFEEISQLVQSALDGYNVCIFAYGQTGSGKTYTMEGPDNPTTEDEGMIPRAVGQVFQTGRMLEEKGWAYEYEASFLEIYNESIRDLLGNGKDDQKHDIKLTGSTSNDVMVSNLTTIMVKSEGKVAHLLKKATENRAVAETKCNERSSRSHSVFRLKITGQNGITGEGCQGTLNLIDLAGSERLKDSGSSGARLKETQAINKSLSTLGQVIMALANKEQHIPYRNSKLTYLLQNSLGGNSKTLMFVNVSPKEDNYSETLNSLRFATKVNQCNIGTATKKVK